MISSIIAAWSDISNALDGTWTSQDPAAVIGGLHTIQQTIERLNVGYVWMFCNCFTSAAFVSSYGARFLFFGDGVMLSGFKFGLQVLSMRKRIKVTGFTDWDTMFYNNLLSIPVLFVFSLLVEDWSQANLVKNLCVP